MPRHHSLFVPRDFDTSPYFAIVKPTLDGAFDYRRLHWCVTTTFAGNNNMSSPHDETLVWGRGTNNTSMNNDAHHRVDHSSRRSLSSSRPHLLRHHAATNGDHQELLQRYGSHHSNYCRSNRSRSSSSILIPTRMLRSTFSDEANQADDEAGDSMDYMLLPAYSFPAVTLVFPNAPRAGWSQGEGDNEPRSSAVSSSSSSRINSQQHPLPIRMMSRQADATSSSSLVPLPASSSSLQVLPRPTIHHEHHHHNHNHNYPLHQQRQKKNEGNSAANTIHTIDTRRPAVAAIEGGNTRSSVTVQAHATRQNNNMNIHAAKNNGNNSNNNTDDVYYWETTNNNNCGDADLTWMSLRQQELPIATTPPTSNKKHKAIPSRPTITTTTTTMTVNMREEGRQNLQSPDERRQHNNTDATTASHTINNDNYHAMQWRGVVNPRRGRATLEQFISRQLGRENDPYHYVFDPVGT